MSLQSILGNFALILFSLTIVTGIIWSIDRFYLAPRRRQALDAALAEYDARTARLLESGVNADTSGRK
jgi:signal peptidase I